MFSVRDPLQEMIRQAVGPEKFKDRVELRGALANIDLAQLPDHLLQRVADGEHIMSDLVSAVPLLEDGSIDGARSGAAG